MTKNIHALQTPEEDPRVTLELKVLSKLAYKTENIFKVPYLGIDHFRYSETQDVFRQIKKQALETGVVDLMLIDADKDIKLRLMPDAIETDMYLKQYAKELVKHSNRERLNGILQQAHLTSLKADPEELIDQMNRDIAEIYRTSEWYPITTWGEEVTRLINKLDSNEVARSTGFPRIDRSMNGGVYRGESYCVVARPKAGKTMLKGSMANNMRKQGAKFLFIAAEMGSMNIVKRMIASDSGLSAYALTGKPDPETANAIVTAGKEKGNIYFVDAPRIKLSALQTVVKNAVINYGIEGFYLDYLQLVSGKEKGETQAEHQENVAQWIAEVCKRENIWCIYSAQINREGTIRGGDGIVMATEWVYEIRMNEKEPGEKHRSAWMSHVATRYSEARNIGSEDTPSLRLLNGTHFIELKTTGEAPVT